MPQNYFLIFILTFGWVLTSCSTLERSRSSGYGESSHARQIAGIPSQISNLQFQRKAATQLGMSYEYALNDPVAYYQIQQRAELIQRERALSGTRQRQQYYYYRSWLKDDTEALTFLRKPGFQARQNWIHAQGIDRRLNDNSGVMQDIVDSSDIAHGMQMELVRKAWGSPTRKEVAGDPVLRNEKWTYSSYLPTPEGYKLETKSVYFENGQVAGWNSNQ